MYVEPLIDARTQWAAGFSILDAGPSPHPMMVQISPHQARLSPFFRTPEYFSTLVCFLPFATPALRLLKPQTIGAQAQTAGKGVMQSRGCSQMLNVEF